MDPREQRAIVERYWAAMQTNDWRAASEFLHEGYVLDWPQSGERIRGRENFVAVNANYPAAGRWHFTINRVVAGEGGVVSDVGVTDGAIVARAITFSTIRDGKIIHQTEFWPDPTKPHAWRAQWVERIKADG
jgi:ketosteroid isomerase-like protein